MKRIFRVYKYNEAYQYGEILKLLVEMYCRADPFNLIKTFGSLAKKIILVPVPMHLSKLRKRGFSSSIMIANWLKNSIVRVCGVEVEVAATVVVKVKQTQAQAGLSKTKRLMNQQNVFKIDEKQLSATLEKGKSITIVVVDDVLSSGATINSVVEELKKAITGNDNAENVKYVGQFAFARG